MRKITWMALVAMLTVSCSLEAQDNTSVRRNRRIEPQTKNRWTAEDRVEAMTKELELTAEQVADLQALFEKQDAERAEQVAAHLAEREQAARNREVRRKEMEEAREKAVAEYNAELERIIGKEKVEQWEKSREKRQQAIRDSNRRGRRDAPRRR